MLLHNAGTPIPSVPIVTMLGPFGPWAKFVLGRSSFATRCARSTLLLLGCFDRPCGAPI